MPEVNFTKPWHGIPREEIDWHPSIDEDACIGCGTCVTGCSRKVYRFDFLHKKAVVADPLNCMVACMTCANTCPTSAISFPPVRSILELADLVEVHHSVEDELLARRDELTATTELPGPDLIVELVVCNIDQIGAGTRILTLTPRRDRDRLCQFVARPVPRAVGAERELAVAGLLDRQRAPARRLARAPDPQGTGRTTLHLGVRAGRGRRRGRSPRPARVFHDALARRPSRCFRGPWYGVRADQGFVGTASRDVLRPRDGLVLGGDVIGGLL